MSSMTRKKKDETTPSVVENAVFPRKERNPKPGVGSKGTVRTEPISGTRYSATEAAALSDLFPHGKEAFASWVESQGLSKLARLTLDEWQVHLTAFTERPITGHRRKNVDDNHRSNRNQIRRRRR